MFERFIISNACMAVAGLMHGYLNHLGIDNHLVQGITKEEMAEYGIAHVWVEVGGEPVETTFVEVENEEHKKLLKNHQMAGIYQKGPVCVMYILLIRLAMHPHIHVLFPPPLDSKEAYLRDGGRFRNVQNFDKSRALREESVLYVDQLRHSTICENVRLIDAGEGEGNVGHLPRGYCIEMDEEGTRTPYREFHLLANLGWVELDLGCSTILLGQ